METKLKLFLKSQLDQLIMPTDKAAYWKGFTVAAEIHKPAVALLQEIATTEAEGKCVVSGKKVREVLGALGL